MKWAWERLRSAARWVYSGSDVLPLEVEIWRPGAKRGAGTQTAPGRERPAEEIGGRLVIGQSHAAGYYAKKCMVRLLFATGIDIFDKKGLQ